ncbi:helix-turn-helix domain-containing protein [Aeromicrobium sp. CF4.19]|uniref:PucR family transcriptional regulator n=1 Tax=Aeromicrobium sp. CF4.19 TaxID=3373082 RepID=UPI003EE6A792
MSIAELEHHPAPPARHVARGTVSLSVSLSGLEGLRNRIDRAIVASVGGRAEDHLLSTVIHEAVTVFVQHGTRPRAAAATIAARLEQIGERQAQAGFTPDDLAACFVLARTEAQRGLCSALSDAVTADQLTSLREDLMAFLHHLSEHARRGLERRRRLLALPPQYRDDMLHAALFEASSRTTLEALAPTVGLDPRAQVVAIVSCSVELPLALRAHPETITNRSALEALVPAEWTVQRVVGMLRGQAVIGPMAALSEAGEVVALTRRAADALREQRAQDPRPLVPCVDLLGELLVGADPLLGDLLAAKHLPPLQAMPTQRRVSLGEFLLHWLERGLPTNQLARDLGIPPQTAHSRMKNVRSIYGSLLEDPRHRLELIAALRAAIPRWQAELG